MRGEIHMRMCVCETWDGPESLRKQRLMQFSGQSTEEEGAEWRENPRSLQMALLMIQLNSDHFICVRKLRQEKEPPGMITYNYYIARDVKGPPSGRREMITQMEIQICTKE